MIRATAWCRADLAGGTLDIWPLGLLHRGARTINVALNLSVVAEWSERTSGFVIHVGDQVVEAASAEALRADARAELLGEIALAGELPAGTLRLSSDSPRGAGLGASSALTVAVLAAGELAREGRLIRNPSERAAVARDLEARLMGLPTGKQDHFPAQLGGALEIEHAAGGENVRRLDVDLAALGDRLLVAFTGQSHFSAGANWQVIRRRLERDPEVVHRLDRIRDVAQAMPDALCGSDWQRVGELIGAEWEARRGLSPEISTPDIERLLSIAVERGAWGGKAGGAGGGGCVFALAPAEALPAIRTAWGEAGAQILEAHPTPRALEVETSPGN